MPHQYNNNHYTHRQQQVFHQAKGYHHSLQTQWKQRIPLLPQTKPRNILWLQYLRMNHHQGFQVRLQVDFGVFVEEKPNGKIKLTICYFCVEENLIIFLFFSLKLLCSIVLFWIIVIVFIIVLALN